MKIFRFVKKWPNVFKNLIWKKKCALKSFEFLLICTFFKVTLWTTSAIWPQIWDHISKRFYLNYCFFKAQNCLETCVNCVWNCVTPLFTPIEVQFSNIIFFKNALLPLLKCWTCSEGDIWMILMRRIMDIFNQGPYKSQFCVKWVGVLLFQENGKMNLNLTKPIIIFFMFLLCLWKVV